MGRILDNPKDFLDGLNDEEFLLLLDDMGISYSKKSKEESVWDYVNLKIETKVYNKNINISSNILKSFKKKEIFCKHYEVDIDLNMNKSLSYANKINREINNYGFSNYGFSNYEFSNYDVPIKNNNDCNSAKAA